MGDSDRKYRQRGYQDSSSGAKSDKEKRPRPPSERLGPRSPQMPGSRTVSRCAQCGAVLTALSQPPGACTGCGAEIHACTQCSYFDPGGHFQCSKPVPEAVPDKRARNECGFFELRSTFERDVTLVGSRTRLDDLFKK